MDECQVKENLSEFFYIRFLVVVNDARNGRNFLFMHLFKMEKREIVLFILESPLPDTFFGLYKKCFI